MVNEKFQIISKLAEAYWIIIAKKKTAI